MKRQTLSEYKFRKLATESFKNAIRLHFDSILLFNNKSYPSSFQLSVLALEEFSKSHWVEHYYYSSITNSGFPEKEFEQKWLKMLYLHPEKQNAFFGWRMHYEYSPKFVEFVNKRQLELKKQRSIYVGLDRVNGKIDVNGRISSPERVKQTDAKQMISLLNDYLIDICERKSIQEFYFDIEEKDELLTEDLLIRLKKWKFKSGIRSMRWFKEWSKIQQATANTSFVK
jgi:AbiV family abortive infection protein